MKIKEIVTELDANRQIGRDVIGGTAKGIGALAGGVVGAGKAAVTGFQSGSAKMKKLLDPSQWFSGDSSDDKPEKDDTAAAAGVSNSLHTASQGLALQGSDSENLKQIQKDIKSGKIGSTDVQNELAALQAAIEGQKLSPEQLQILKALNNRI